MKQTYTGGCHCGAVRYEADMDLSQGTLKCNCSMCRKMRAWLVGIGSDDFRLLKGQEALSDYQFGSKNIHHLFCKHCGVKSFGRGAGRRRAARRDSAEHCRQHSRCRPRRDACHVRRRAQRQLRSRAGRDALHVTRIAIRASRA